MADLKEKLYILGAQKLTGKYEMSKQVPLDLDLHFKFHNKEKYTVREKYPSFKACTLLTTKSAV